MPLSAALADAALAAAGQARATGRLRRAGAAARCGRCSNCSSAGRRCRRRDTLLRRDAATRARASHLFLYPFAGRLGAPGPGLPARLARRRACSRAPSRSPSTTTAWSCSRAEPSIWHAAVRARPRPCLLSMPSACCDDVLASLNAAELAQRRFREIARVSGLVFQGYPGAAEEQRASCRPRRACSSRCSASTTPATCC